MAKSILMVDDEPEVVEFVRVLLMEEGYEVVGALGGEEALKIAKKEKPDLIILDIMMPGMNGFELGYALKTEPKTNNIPIIYLTVLREQKDKDEAQKIGVEDYITKPFDPKALLQAIVKTIGN